MDTRPKYVVAKVKEKPRIITEHDLEDTKQKFDQLQFDMETLVGLKKHDSLFNCYFENILLHVFL